MKNKKLLLALCLPIFFLLGLTVYNQYVVVSGQQFLLPIEGYDPRDLLAGNYIRFQIVYGVSRDCQQELVSPAFMCVKPAQKLMIGAVEPRCEAWIPGECRGRRFNDRLNRFYVAQEDAKEIEAKVLAKRMQVKLAVGKGHARIIDLVER